MLQPALVILDVKLLGISGLDVCQHLERNAATAPFEPGDLLRHARSLLGPQ